MWCHWRARRELQRPPLVMFFMLLPRVPSHPPSRSLQASSRCRLKERCKAFISFTCLIPTARHDLPAATGKLKRSNLSTVDQKTSGAAFAFAFLRWKQTTARRRGQQLDLLTTRPGEGPAESREGSTGLTVAETSTLDWLSASSFDVFRSFYLMGKWPSHCPTAVIPASSWLHILQLDEQSRQRCPVDQDFALFRKIENMHDNTHGWYLLTNVSSQSYHSAILCYPLLEVEERQTDCCQLTGILLVCIHSQKVYNHRSNRVTVWMLQRLSLSWCCIPCTHLHKCRIINTTVSMHGILDVWGRYLTEMLLIPNWCDKVKAFTLNVTMTACWKYPFSMLSARLFTAFVFAVVFQLRRVLSISPAGV